MSKSRTPEEERRWQEARLITLARDEYKCTFCGEEVDSSSDLNVHHIIPYDGDARRDEPSNLRTICAGCHALHHMNYHASLGKKWLIKWAVP